MTGDIKGGAELAERATEQRGAGPNLAHRFEDVTKSGALRR